MFALSFTLSLIIFFNYLSIYIFSTWS